MIALRNIILTACLMLMPAFMSAQSSIDKIVESLEEDKNVENVMYSEQRDPSTKKIIKSSRIIQFSSDKIAAKLISAFKKEREKAISYKSTNHPSNTVYEIAFNDGNGFTAKYTLVQQGGSKWMLSASILHYRKNKGRRDQTSYQSDSDEGLFDELLLNANKNQISYVVNNGNGLNYTEYLNLPGLDENEEEPDKIVVARETDSGCETFVIYNNKNKAKGEPYRTVTQTTASGKTVYHRYF